MEHKSGRLEVIAGPMYSGKSEELIRRLRRAQIAGKKIRAFKPSIDHRYEIEHIASHNGTKIECFPISHPKDLLDLSKEHDVVGIDEAQFFDYKLQMAVRVLIKRGKTVIMSGLDMTYRAEPWESFPYFMAICDDITKLTAICHKCGEEAIFTQRLIDGKPAPFSGDTVQVGGLDSYEARCRNCFEPGE